MNDGGARNARFEQRAARLFQVLCDQFISVAERDAVTAAASISFITA